MSDNLRDKSIHTVRRDFQYYALKKLNPLFNTHPMVNIGVSLVALTALSMIDQQMAVVPSYMINKSLDGIKYLYKKIEKILKKGSVEKYKKSIIIDKIIEDRSVNGLYDAVMWYLSAKIDLKDEPTLRLSVNKKFDRAVEDLPEVNRKVVKDIVRKFMFEEKEIKYLLTEFQVQLEGEKAARKNERVELWYEALNSSENLLERFTQLCLENYNNNLKVIQKKRMIYQSEGGRWVSASEQPKELYDTLIFKNGDKESLINEVEHFINNREWYIKRGFPPSLGILLYGSPGCGKTSIIRWISYMTKRNTHYLKLSQIRNERDFFSLLKDLNLDETVLVMEDIDCANKITLRRDVKYEINKEEEEGTVAPAEVASTSSPIQVVVQTQPNKDNTAQKEREKQNDKLTLDVLLNILDGVLTSSGQIVIMTTNYKDVLDQALIRPGRITLSLHLHKCDREMLSKLFKNFYSLTEISPESQQLIDTIKDDEYSPAHVMNSFRKCKENPLDGLKMITVKEE